MDREELEQHQGDFLCVALFICGERDRERERGWRSLLMQSEQSKAEYQLEGKSGASSRGNSSSKMLK